MKKLILLSIVSIFLFYPCFADNTLKLPETIVVIDQQVQEKTAFPNGVFLEITAVDVSTSELIIIIYRISEKDSKQELSSITKTGMKVDLVKQENINN